MEDFTIRQDPNKNYNPSAGEEEKDEGKDLSCKHFKEVNDGAFLNNSDESITKENGNVTKKDDQTSKGHCKIQQRAVFSGKILSFGCSLCKGNQTFSPNDLLKHFRAVHKGSLPSYPCDLCDFVTNEFSALQRHRIEHRNTLVTCELCNDNVQYSLLLLTRHYMMCHSINGEFKCDWCEFTTVDAGTFVQHIHHHNESHWKCSKCKHISLNEDDHHNHMKAHFGTFSFTCQICGFGTAESEHLKKHIAVVHKEEAQRKNALKATEDSAEYSSTNIKLYKKIGISQETQGMSKLNTPPGTVSNENSRVPKQELPLEEMHHLIDGTVGRKKNRCWSFHNPEHLTPVMTQDCENANYSDTGSHPNANGLTVLKVKNKISLPPNCTTKVMGFKIVDGKKHLVLKVIPTAKQDAGPFVSNPAIAKKIDFVEKEQFSECKGSTSKTLPISPRNGSSNQMVCEDIMAVKVKIEEEETYVCTLNRTPHSDSKQLNLLQTQSYPVANEGTHSDCEPVCTEKGKVTLAKDSDAPDFICDEASYESKKSHTKIESECITTCQFPLNATLKTLPSKTVCRESAEKSGATDESSLTDGFGRLCKKYKANSVTNSLCTDSSCQVALINSDGTSIENRSKSCQELVKHLESPSQLPKPFSVGSRVEGLTTGKGDPKPSNQEVFTFHNYSKEMFSSSPGNTQNLPCTGENLGHTQNACDSSQFRLKLTESPQHTSATTDGDVEVDECIANNDLLTEDHGDSVLKDFNIIKIEEDFIPISTKHSETNTSLHSMESFVKEHSNAIITAQLNKERTGHSNVTNAVLKQAKNPLKIHLPGVKQPVLVRATKNKYAMPVQVKAAPGFKLITNSPNPQISLTCLKQDINNSTNTTGVTLTPKAKIVGVAAGNPLTTEKGTVLSAVHSVGRTSSNHYFINSPGFKGPVLLSRTLHSTPTNMVAKAQPTCYFVQRSVPSVQKPSTTSFKLPGPQLPVNSQPIQVGTIAEKVSTPQAGRQAYLVRYLSPSRSSLLGNKQDTKNRTIWNQTNECSGNKVIFKIVSPTARLNTTVASTSSSQPLLLATRPEGQCFLVSANITRSTSCEVNKLVGVKNDLQDHQEEPSLSHSLNGNLKPFEKNRLLAPRLISHGKRHRKALFDELPATLHKVRRLSNKVLTEKDNVLWTPVGKEVERTLRLAPFSTEQKIKYPCSYQPVVVLNHPDADIPEVMNLMKVVNRHKGAVTKVALSQKTVQALSEFSGLVNNCSTSLNEDVLRPRPVLSSVRERFLLKLKLKKKNKKKYEVVKTLSAHGQDSVVFDCWFCGRLFNNQEDWIGHGQRHLMEATRDWNKFF